MPNTTLRGGLFDATNLNAPRVHFKEKEILCIGGDRIVYSGEQLRQNDHTVWMHLIHLARTSPAGSDITFSGYTFLRAIGSGRSIKDLRRLIVILKRLQGARIEVYSRSVGGALFMSMLPWIQCIGYPDDEEITADRKTGESIWRVRMPAELVTLFGNQSYTKIDIMQRIKLDRPVALWLHGYLASHKAPLPVLLSTIGNAGGLKSTGSKLKGVVENAMNELQSVGFVESWDIKDNKLFVVRSEKDEVNN